MQEIQALEGPDGREFHFFSLGDENYLARINFISGSKTTPVSALQSQIYRWDGKQFALAESFDTFGGTSAGTFSVDGRDYLAVSNSLSTDIRFRVDSIIYQLSTGHAEQ